MNTNKMLITIVTSYLIIILTSPVFASNYSMPSFVEEANNKGSECAVAFSKSRISNKENRLAHQCSQTCNQIYGLHNRMVDDKVMETQLWRCRRSYNVFKSPDKYLVPPVKFIKLPSTASKIEAQLLTMHREIRELIKAIDKNEGCLSPRVLEEIETKRLPLRKAKTAWKLCALKYHNISRIYASKLVED